ncbi:hypothetical protein BSG1_16065 [Bacillus sp. SG-1]|nr:hypothetical protein BSG1_16065 [Bacillus sp. SG-1]
MKSLFWIEMIKEGADLMMTMFLASKIEEDAGATGMMTAMTEEMTISATIGPGFNTAVKRFLM